LQLNCTYKKYKVKNSLTLPSNMWYFHTAKYQQLCQLKFLYYHNTMIVNVV
jgi:hypothetical protein